MRSMDLRRFPIRRRFVALMCYFVAPFTVLLAASPRSSGEPVPVDVTATYSGKIQLKEEEGEGVRLRAQNEFGLRLSVKGRRKNTLTFSGNVQAVHPRGEPLYGDMALELKLHPIEGLSVAARADAAMGFEGDDEPQDYQRLRSALEVGWGSSRRGLSGKLSFGCEDMSFLDAPLRSYNELTQELSMKAVISRPLELRVDVVRMAKLYDRKSDNDSSKLTWGAILKFEPSPVLEFVPFAGGVIKDYPRREYLGYRQGLAGASFKWEVCDFATLSSSWVGSEKRFPRAPVKDQLRATYSLALELSPAAKWDLALKWAKSDYDYPQAPGKGSSRVSGGAVVRFHPMDGIELKASGELADRELEESDPLDYERSLLAGCGLTWDVREDMRLSVSYRSRREAAGNPGVWGGASSTYEFRILRKFG